MYINTQYGIGLIIKQFANGFAFVSFSNRKYPLMVSNKNVIYALPSET